MVKFFLSFVKSSIKEKVKKDIFKENPEDFVKYHEEPALFIISKEDKMISYEHME